MYTIIYIIHMQTQAVTTINRIRGLSFPQAKTLKMTAKVAKTMVLIKRGNHNAIELI